MKISHPALIVGESLAFRGLSSTPASFLKSYGAVGACLRCSKGVLRSPCAQVGVSAARGYVTRKLMKCVQNVNRPLKSKTGERGHAAYCLRGGAADHVHHLSISVAKRFS